MFRSKKHVAILTIILTLITFTIASAAHTTKESNDGQVDPDWVNISVRGLAGIDFATADHDVEKSTPIAPLTITPIVQQAYVKASNTGTNDHFGGKVAMDGDTAVVWASYEDSSATGINGNEGNNSATDSGAVYVFTRNGSTWSQQAYIKASNTGANDGFGNALAVDGDTLVVGARYEDSSALGINGDQANNSATDSGAVYVFTRNGSTWSQQAYIKASNTGAGDCFGVSVALDGDTLVVGAHYEDSSTTGVNGNQNDDSASNTGAVYVFTRNGEVWSQQAYIKASFTDTDDGADNLGIAVALTGDTMVAGAWGEDSNAIGVGGDQNNNLMANSGAVYVFTRNASTWSQQAYIKASNTGLLDYFGRAVAMYGDTLIVGAYHESSNSTGIGGNQVDNSLVGAGAVYVFVRSGTTWSQQAYVKSSTAGSNYFGDSVAIDENIMVVGAGYESSNANGVDGDQSDNSAWHAGAAYIFTRTGDAWSQQAYLKASNSDTDDNFGYFGGVGIDGNTVVVGAFNEDSNATGIDGDQENNLSSYSGASYFFHLSIPVLNQHVFLPLVTR